MLERRVKIYVSVFYCLWRCFSVCDIVFLFFYLFISDLVSDVMVLLIMSSFNTVKTELIILPAARPLNSVVIVVAFVCVCVYLLPYC